MLYPFAVLCIALMLLCIMLIFLGLPGTWAMIVLTGIWAFASGAIGFGWQFFALLVGLAVVGEVIEFVAGDIGAKRYGGTKKGSLGGIVGAIAGGILCAPLFFGFGALLGTLAGAYTGCFAMEKLHGATPAAAAKAALGSTLGRFGGFVVKLGIGIVIIWLSAPRIWASV